MDVLPEYLNHGDLLVSATDSTGRRVENKAVREAKDHNGEYIVVTFTDGDSGSFPRDTTVEVIR